MTLDPKRYKAIMKRKKAVTPPPTPPVKKEESGDKSFDDAVDKMLGIPPKKK